MTRYSTYFAYKTTLKNGSAGFSRAARTTKRDCNTCVVPNRRTLLATSMVGLCSPLLGLVWFDSIRFYSGRPRCSCSSIYVDASMRHLLCVLLGHVMLCGAPPLSAVPGPWLLSWWDVDARLELESNRMPRPTIKIQSYFNSIHTSLRNPSLIPTGSYKRIRANTVRWAAHGSHHALPGRPFPTSTRPSLGARASAQSRPLPLPLTLALTLRDACSASLGLSTRVLPSRRGRGAFPPPREIGEEQIGGDVPGSEPV
jgi:hypothetical protein